MLFAVLRALPVCMLTYYRNISFVAKLITLQLQHSIQSIIFYINIHHIEKQAKDKTRGIQTDRYVMSWSFKGSDDGAL
jgi:hypothetical protein